MAFEPVEFHSAAKRIASTGGSEAELRTSVGRAYFAAFLVARECLRNRLPAKKLNRHGDVIKKVKGLDERTGTKLLELFRLRHEADYNLTPSDTQYVDWSRNWEKANLVAEQIIPRFYSI